MGQDSPDEKWLQNEPIAIVGMSCQFPGDANTPEKFWKLLIDEKDAVKEIPSTRMEMSSIYSASPGQDAKSKSKWAGLVEDFDQFDSHFFGLARREVERMDPQQRMLLSGVWTALENSGLAPLSLARSQTGVFIGIMSSEYLQMRILETQPQEKFQYLASGSVFSSAAGRISFVFDFHGPCVAVDTACSSSLVSLHQACQSLRTRECDMAVAGGVNVLLSPEMLIHLSKDGFLSPTGRCHTFDERADGFVRGEGCGIVVLKRLSDAVRDKHTIYALALGSAINHGGRSNTLTSPNGISQEQVLRMALRSAHVQAREVSYVEAHGTGTPLGDPIEVDAIGAVYSEGRDRSNPLILGTAKANLGHLEGAAGIAGVIKTVLSLQNRTIPKHINFAKVNPHISLEKNNVTLPLAKTAWTSPGRLVAGVSSFGFAGTNAHIILAEAPPQNQRNFRDRQEWTLCVSAKAADALKAYFAHYLEYLEKNPETNLGDLAFTANVGRSHFTHRAGFSFKTVGDLKARLVEAVLGKQSDRVFLGTLSEDQPIKLRLVHTPHLKLSFGADLFAFYSRFRDLCQRIDTLSTDLVQGSLHDYFSTPTAEARPSDPNLTMLANFALLAGIGELLKDFGVKISAHLGVGFGHFSAAYLAGVLSLENSLALILGRGVAGLADQIPLAASQLKHFSLGKNGSIEQADSTNPRFWDSLDWDGLPIQQINQTLQSHSHLGWSDFAAGVENLSLTLAQIFSFGAEINWELVENPFPRKRISLPTYPFQNQKLPFLYQRAPVAPAIAPRQSDVIVLTPATSSKIPVDDIRAKIVQRFVEVMRIEKEALTGTRKFTEIGLDSPMAVEIRAYLAQDFKADLPQTLLLDYPTLNELVAFLNQQAA